MNKLLLIIIAVSVCFSQTTPDLTSKQRYLNGFVDGSRPYRGINVKPVWEIGYYGQGIQVADIQYDWDLDHEDLQDKNIQVHYDNIDAGQQQHGTNAIGIIGADKNDFGMTGIAYGCELSVWDIYDEMAQLASWGRSIRGAADALSEGDIIQLEVSLATSSSSPPLPAEINPALHEAIKYAVNKGIIVLQASGNGATNLDYSGDMPSDDNGSIMVGNGSLMQERIVTNNYISGGNYGKRVNLQAWGDTVVATLGTWSWTGVTPISGFHGETFGNNDQRAYCYQFSGTSSALPIVTGVVAVVQSFAKDSLGYTLTSQEMRDLLIRSGHPQDSSSVSGHIGPIPDAFRAIKYLTGDTLGTDITNKNINSNNNFVTLKENILYLNPNLKNREIKIININGQTVKSISLEKEAKINLKSLKLSKGFYIINYTEGIRNRSVKWHNR